MFHGYWDSRKFLLLVVVSSLSLSSCESLHITRYLYLRFSFLHSLFIHSLPPSSCSSRSESGEGSHLSEAAAGRATLPAGPECVNLHRPFGGLSAPADCPGYCAHLPALYPHRGQAHHQPEKLRQDTMYFHNKIGKKNTSVCVCVQCHILRVNTHKCLRYFVNVHIQTVQTIVLYIYTYTHCHICCRHLTHCYSCLKHITTTPHSLFAQLCFLYHSQKFGLHGVGRSFFNLVDSYQIPSGL